MKILDRYLIREIVPPFLVALGMFTFLLAVNPMLMQAKDLLAKGINIGTVGFMLLMLLPQALGVTLPMALLAGLLMALGRLSGDRESVALLACGVSPARLLKPVVMLAVVVGLADLYVMTIVLPDANQRFRVESYRLIAQRGQSDIKPGVFYEGFPGKVLFVREIRPDGTWAGVTLADTSQPGRPSLTMARSGFLDLQPDLRQVSIVLTGNPVRHVPGGAEDVYDTSTATELRFAIPAEQVFGDGNIMPTRGRAEMTWGALRAEEEKKIKAGGGKSQDEMFKAGLSTHPEVLQRHQMLSFPVACVVFSILGVVLGLHTRREGKLAGFTLGLVVIAAYYGVMVFFEGLTQGNRFPAAWARWVPNILFGLIGIVAILMRNRTVAPGGTIVLPAWLRIFRRPKSTTLASANAGQTATPARPVIVIRIPELNIPAPRILDRYVAMRYLKVITLSFVGLLTLYYIITFIDRSGRMFKGQTSTAVLIEYFAYSTPQFVVYLMPTAILVAVLATIGGLTRTGELTVMRACGVSLYRVAAPLLILAMAWSSGLFLLDDRVLAQANRRAETLEGQMRGLPPRTNLIANANWTAGPDGRLYYYVAFDADRGIVHSLSIFQPLPDGSKLASHTFIQRAVFKQTTDWQIDGGWVQRFLANDRSTREVLKPSNVTLLSPDRFEGGHSREADLMTFGDLERHIKDLSQSGINLTEQRVRLESRLAFPLVTLVMTLIGVPFGVSTGRHGALYGVGLAIILGATYWLANTFFLAAGAAGLLSPVLAAWAANLLFLAFGFYAVFTVRT